MKPSELQDNEIRLKKLWLECVPDRDLDVFEADSGSARQNQTIIYDSTTINDTKTMGQSMKIDGRR